VRNTAAAITLVGAVVLGGAAGASILRPGAVNAATSSPAASFASAAVSTSTTTGSSSTTSAPSTTTTAPSTGTSPSTGTNPATGQGACDGPGGHGFGDPNETVSDLSVVAKATGISESSLQAALGNGQTVAAVAKAHNVDVQAVINALVQDGLDELTAQVKAGTLTQAQADGQKASVTQRATDQVNGTLGGGMHGPGH
jgi:hypothetical protein